jgi:CarD family transcriptional regulator
MKTSVASTAVTRAPKAAPDVVAAGKPVAARKTVAARPGPVAETSVAETAPHAQAQATPKKPAAKSAGAPNVPVTSPSAAQPESPKHVTSTKHSPAAPSAPAAPAPKAEAVGKPVEAAAPEAAAPGVAAPRPVETVAPAPATGMRPSQPPMANGRPQPPSRAAAKEENFVQGDFVVYPTHGVGRVEEIKTEEIAGQKLELIHITFEENRMKLRVPVPKARSAGLRKLATRKMFDEALAVLKGRARIKRTMWSRRAQEYEAKINSGDPIAIAEVVRDLHRNAGQPDQSFSERQIYEAAMDRLAAELGALDQTDKATAVGKLASYLKTV